MTHGDIFTKFMVEYDKLDTISSYPTLTPYEIAETLNKAYLALITEKFTGNNPRNIGFEGDNKAIEDIRPLITTNVVTRNQNQDEYLTAPNEIVFDVPQNMLYHIQSTLNVLGGNESIDDINHNKIPTNFITHEDAKKFKGSYNNLPWIKEPMLYLENDYFHVLYDTFQFKSFPEKSELFVTYIKIPNVFQYLSEDENSKNLEFELGNSVAEELINLAIIMATDITQSPRMQSKLQIRPLES